MQPQKGTKISKQKIICGICAILWVSLCTPLHALPPTQDVSVEVFQVFELPVNVHEALLVKSDKGYLLKLSLANSSEVKIIGLRYSIVSINSENEVRFRVNRTEGFSISPYAVKSLTFKTPIKFKPNGERLILMIEQVISRESIWEVVKAKEALEAYARGDYSVMPAVLRVANQVDVPPRIELKY